MDENSFKGRNFPKRIELQTGLIKKHTNMNFSTKYLLILSAFSVIISGCSKGGSTPPVVIPDTTKPTITITKPSAAQIFSAGATIPFEVTFTDNEALKSYDVTISKSTLGALALKNVPTSVAFSYTRSTSGLSGKSQTITITDIIIPTNTLLQIVSTGTYNIKVNCSDASNNSSSQTLVITIN